MRFLIVLILLAVPALADPGDGFNYDTEHWSACEPLLDSDCGRMDITRPEYPPTHWEGIAIDYWPLHDAPCDAKVCHVQSIGPLKEVCGEPGPGEFSFDGKRLRFFTAEVSRYRFIAVKAYLKRGPGRNLTRNPPACGIS